MREIDWQTILMCLPHILTSAALIPATDTVVNHILIVEAVPEEQRRRSDIYEELRRSGCAMLASCLFGGAQTFPVMADTSLYFEMGGTTSWGVLVPVAMHAAFLLIPASRSVLSFMPKCVPGF